ncbi:MAG: T9SS type A sorting domain-containing protein [Candidatus Coatesbacteria bacterium]|nr:MAG: T9SS type A sorting domain-containing protein [Candidatus Coatesbacteria bacterium]
MKNKLLLAITLGWAAAAAAYAPPENPLDVGDRLYSGPFLEAKTGTPLASRAAHNYDALKYTITMAIDDQAETVAATTTVKIKGTAAQITQFELDLTTDLTVRRVTRGATRLSFQHANDLLLITLDRPLRQGETAEVAIQYDGTPGYGFFFTADGVFTSTEMSYSRNWFPCYDDPGDKAGEGVELYITVRDDWYVASNGLLAQTSPAGADSTEYHWVHRYPIATYLVAIACAEYYTGFNHQWRGMPVNYYIYDNQRTAAPIYFEHQPDMLDYCAATFGDYPFQNEKYGVAAVNMTNFGGMENQTCTYIRSTYIQPNHNGDHLLIHELVHSWWGDMVTCGTWKDLWLNEGQATYGDALYTESRYGGASFRQQMQSYAQSYFREDEERRFSVYDPRYPWSSTVYRKGAWVLHMLRRLMGDEAFYTAWNNYGAKYKYGTAVTDDLQAEFEAEYGGDLDWFFQQWVYKAGYPEFKYAWTKSNGGKTVKVTIDQVQEVTPLTPLFKCLVDLTFASTSDTDYVKSEWVDGRNHTFEYTFPEEIYWVYFDRDVWLLQKNTVNIGIALDYFRARRTNAGVALSWATSAEKDLAGYNLYRESDAASPEGGRTKLNASLITGRSPYRFLDETAARGAAYEYWLEAVDLGGGGETYGPAKVSLPTKPYAFALYQNAPNPTRGATTFSFSLPAAGPAALTVYDLAGREVWQYEGDFAEGLNDVEAAFALAPGVYLYRLAAGNDAASRKMVVAP